MKYNNRYHMFFNGKNRNYKTISKAISQQIENDGGKITMYPCDPDDNVAWLKTWEKADVKTGDNIIIYFHGGTHHSGPIDVIVLKEMEKKDLSRSTLYLISCGAIRETESGEVVRHCLAKLISKLLKPEYLVAANGYITLSGSSKFLYIKPFIKINVHSKEKDIKNFDRDFTLFNKEGERISKFGGEFFSINDLIKKAEKEKA